MLLTWLTRGPRKQRTDPCNGLWMNSVVKQVLLDNPLSSTTPSFLFARPTGGGWGYLAKSEARWYGIRTGHEQLDAPC